MTNPIRTVLTGALLTLALAGCNSDSGSSNSTANTQNTPAASTSADDRSLTQTRNDFSESFCPTTASATTASMDSQACENEAAQSVSPAQKDELARFCPEAASQVGADSGFPASCLGEADALFTALAPIMGGLSPLAAQLCPVTNGAGNSNPMDCFAEAVANASGQLPGSGDGDSLPELPGFDGIDGVPGDDGIPGADAFAQQICPRTAAGGEFSQSTPFECLTEAGRNLQMASELLFQSNPLTDAACPLASVANPVDPVACFTEAAGQFVPSEIAEFNQIPGLSGFDGIPGVDQLREFATLINDNADAGFENVPGFAEACGDASNPLTCLLAVGDRFAQVRGLLLEENPLVQAVCPDNTIDPVGCFIAGLGGLADLAPGDGAPDFDGLPGLDRLTDLFSGGADDLPGLDGLTELADLLNGGGDDLPGLEDLFGLTDVLTGLLSGGGYDLPGLDSLTQLTDLLGGAADLPGLENLSDLADLLGDGGDFDFPGPDGLDGLADLADLLNAQDLDLPGLDSLNLLVDLLSGAGGEGVPGLDALPGFAELCGDNSDPFSCLLAAGDSFGGLQDLLGDDMIADQFCPMAGTDDPVGCFTELLGSLTTVPDGDLPLIGDLLGTLTSLQP